MPFNIKTEGYNLKFKKSSNELTIECYDHERYCVGRISIIVNEKEKEKLIKKLMRWKF